MIPVIKETANRILEQNPGVVVRYRLLRDVLGEETSDPKLLNAKEDLGESKWVQELGSEQWEDGGWGRFHSRNTRLKQKVITTEVGVERGLALGLDSSHPLMQKASAHILAIMEGDVQFPDTPELNDRWDTGMQMFLASTLSLINPTHPALNEVRNLWIEIARRTFQSGVYCERDEINAHADLTGATVKDSYLVLDNKYALNILGSIHGTLLEETELALLQWLWNKMDGIGYLEIPLNRPPPQKPGPFDRWLVSLEMLSRLFPNWERFSQSSIEWLWTQRNEAGYWDFGPRPSSIVTLPLSDSWRNKRNRLFDWTNRILILLRQYYDGSSHS